MNDYLLEVLADMIQRELLDPERVPIHEAGHVVVAYFHRYQVTKATVQPNYFPDDPNDLYMGQVDYDPPWPDDDDATYATWHTRARIMAEVGLAGRAAEIEKFGELRPVHEEGHAYDLAGVRRLLEVLYIPKTEAETYAYIDRAERRARSILRQTWPTVTRVAAELHAQRTLDQETLQALLRCIPTRARWEADKRWMKKIGADGIEYYEPEE